MSSPFADASTGPSAASPPFCPLCGAARAPDLSVCWLCHAPLNAVPDAALPAKIVDERVAAANPSQFSIATVLLVTTLVAVCLGLFRFSPGLGVALLVFSAPALVRTISVGRREKRHGQRMTTGGKIGHFLLSLLIMYAVWTAACFAFFIAAMGTCFAAVLASNASEGAAVGVGIVGLILSLVAALAVATLILRATWPKRT